MSDYDTQTEVTVMIIKNQSAVSREVQCNRTSDGWYRPVAVHRRAREREADRSRGRKMDHPELSRNVLIGLRWCWSPKQILGRIRIECEDNPSMWTSHEMIYSWIWGDKCQDHKKYKLRARGKANGRKTIPNRTWIDERPGEVHDGNRPGDW